MTTTEPPKLFTNKPKKAAQLKNLLQQQQQQQHQFSSPPPPPPPTESFARRYKFLWPLLLAVNLGVGVYLFTRTKKKDSEDIENLEVEEITPTTTPTPTPISVTADVAVISSSKPIVEAPKNRERVPENQQRELFKWLLEEKRKIKPKNAEEKKQLDEEKAILKQFIGAKYTPTM
ncbi:uncharacterized protein LOC124918731 [Impatiens glandulifera]|uniref:uncharacterized protein LOC124918731 n=1 Tax=Impatiens glandulifera TaxID=253017 RepID=UPI001FB191BA|nr:uncharacterized protein LOC124918731 [Impatiens glandulifera]